MAEETVNILALILVLIAVLEAIYLNYLTNKMIKKKDGRSKNMIEATQKMIEQSKRDTDRMIEE